MRIEVCRNGVEVAVEFEPADQIDTYQMADFVAVTAGAALDVIQRKTAEAAGDTLPDCML